MNKGELHESIMRYDSTVLLTGTAYAQYSEVNHKENQILIGATGVNDTVSTSALAILPFDQGDYKGWVGLYYQQATVDGEVVSDVRNGRAEGGIGIGIAGASLNTFVEVSSDMEKGVDRQLQVGGFIRYEFKGFDRDITVGAGNFVENEQVIADLGDSPGNVSRSLFYISTKVLGVSILVEGAPKTTDFSDTRITVEPKYVRKLSDTIAFVASAIVEYDYRAPPQRARMSTLATHYS